MLAMLKGDGRSVVWAVLFSSGSLIISMPHILKQIFWLNDNRVGGTK
jgi:hypothetical protein